MITMHPYHLHKIKFTEISEIYTSETIKNLAYSLVGIFIPIFLLKNGLTFRELCMLFVMQNVLRFFLEHFVGRAIARYGGKHTLALSYPFSFIYIVLLSIYPNHPTPLPLIAIIWAIADSMHWVAYQAAFSKAKDKYKSGREISAIGILATMVGVIGPITGGYVASKYGLNTIFIISPILLLVAMVPLYQSIDTIRSQKLKFDGMVRKISKDLFAHAALSFDVVVGTIIWPLFIYFIVDDYFKLGSIVSISFFLSIFALLVIGKVSDILNKKKLIIVGSSGLVIINIFRNMATTFWFAFGVNLAAIIIGPLLSIPLFSLFYSHADSSRRIEYIVLMEMAGDIARATLWGILFLLTYQLSQRQLFTSAFALAAMSLLFTNVVKLRTK